MSKTDKDILKTEEQEHGPGSDEKLSTADDGSPSQSERRAWFSSMITHTTAKVRKNKGKGFDRRIFIRRAKTKTGNEQQVICPFKGKHLSELESIVNTFTIAARFEGIDDSNVAFHIQLEKVFVCKECDVIFDNLNHLLTLLMETKVDKVLLVHLDGQRECYGCKICRQTENEEDSMKNHLLTHAEAKHITCETCEEMSTVSYEHTNDDITYSDKEFKKVQIIQIVASCRQCNKILLAVPAVLPEVATIDDYSFTLSTQEIAYFCSECNSDISPKYHGKLERTNTLMSRKPLCENCQEYGRYKSAQMGRIGRARNSWTSYIEDPSHSELFPLRHPPPPRRHVFITNIDNPIEMDAKDFIIKDTCNDVKHSWYTCRLCGVAFTDNKEVEVHIYNHISTVTACCGNSITTPATA